MMTSTVRQEMTWFIVKRTKICSPTAIAVQDSVEDNNKKCLLFHLAKTKKEKLDNSSLSKI